MPETAAHNKSVNVYFQLRQSAFMPGNSRVKLPNVNYIGCS